MKRGVKLEQLTWIEAEQWLGDDPVVVLPLGAAAKEHGPHLPLNNDALIADWLAEEIMQQLPVVVAPLINASFYPAFVDYPGSINLRLETARDLVLDTCNSLARFGVTRFYVINTGMSTIRPLDEVAKRLAPAVRFAYLNLEQVLQALPADLLQQRYGSHADEHETSLMLHIAPQVVDMSRAVDDGAEGEGRLSRERGQGTWSRSGVYGQATLANASKGQTIARELLRHCLEQIEELAR